MSGTAVKGKLQAGTCQFCGCTWDSMSKRGDGEPAGWGDMSRTWCLAEPCARAQFNGNRNARRKLVADRVAAVRPIAKRVNDSRREKRERAARRKKAGRQ